MKKWIDPNQFREKFEKYLSSLILITFFIRLDNAKVHAYKSHSPDEFIECPLCKNYYAKNRYDWNEHAKKVHQMSAHDMKNLQIIYSNFDPNDPCMVKRPDGKVACLKCLDDQGCHKTFTRADNAKVHFKKIHGQQLNAKM